MATIDYKQLKKDLRIDAKGLGIPSGSAEIFINKTLKATEKALKNKQIITDKDLNRIIAKELKKYHADFAYVYQNRDTII